MRRAIAVAVLALLCVGAGKKEGLDWESPKKAWKINKGALSASGGMVFLKAAPFANFTARGKLRVEAFQQGPTHAGIMFRYNTDGGDESFYRLTFYAKEITLNRMHISAGGSSWTPIARQKTAPPIKKWIKWQIAAKGGKVKAKVGRLTLEAVDANPYSAGRFGFIAKGVTMTVKDVHLVTQK